MTLSRASISSNLKIVGDISEMIGILETILAISNDNNDNHGLRFNSTIGNANTSGQDRCKQHQFPARRDWLSNDMLREICNFVAIDYYMFDFAPPDVCREDLQKKGVI